MTPPPLPDHLPGEPPLRSWSPVAVALELLRKVVVLVLALAVGLPLWPIYLALRLFLPRPPNLPSAARVRRLLRLLVVERPPAPGLSAVARAAIALTVLTRQATLPWFGLAWYLDDLLYGRRTRQVRIQEPLIEISAARSGSTQLAHYLEDDPHIVAPSLLQTIYPYLWLWKLASVTLGRLLSPDRVREIVEKQFPPAYVQRHELDPFRTDTFEMMFILRQLGEVSAYLGPRVTLEDMHVGRLPPGGHPMWEDDLLRFMDALGRKVLLHARSQPGVGERRLMIKGHFLMVADALEHQYPDARFLTVIRAPDKRLQSIINYNRSHPSEPLFGAYPWPWLIQHSLIVETDYCESEMAWFSRADGARRCVVSFDDYVRDLEGTMRRVYRECLDMDALPPHVPTTHAPRVRTNYLIDRSLEQLGVDVAAFNARLQPYIQWMKRGSARGGREREAQ